MHDEGEALAGAEKFVVFIDMLGFSDLTEAHPVEPQALRAMDHPETIAEGDFLRKAGSNRLVSAYARFQSILYKARVGYLDYTNSTVISFSDSAFVAVNNILHAIYFASDVMREMIVHKIPVRMGIGFGSFLVLRFRSDQTLTSGYHAAEFLGTAVVRAHGAEKCGVKGLRILVHPSVAMHPQARSPIFRHPDEGTKSPFIPIAADERSNRANVSLEVNYAYLRTNKRFLEPLRVMAEEAPLSARAHYEASLEAFERMTTAVGPNAYQD